MGEAVIDRAEAETELSKFFALSAALGGANLTMFSDYVDRAWHEMMREPKRYEAFCKNACGVTLGHIPSGKTNPIVVVEWIADYERKHGQLPPVWFADEHGVLQDDAYRDYLESHTVVAAWKCTPSTGATSSGGATVPVRAE